MKTTAWLLTLDERMTLASALDALLPPQGSFPLPSATGLIDDFIMERVPAGPDAHGWTPYPFIDAAGLKEAIAEIARIASNTDEMSTALRQFEQGNPVLFIALWRLAVYGYYSRPDTIAAISRDLAPAYHGAPLPLGYTHAMAAWDAEDPLQFPRNPRGSYILTDDIRRVDLAELPEEWRIR